MFDIKWIRENPEAFDASLKRRGLEPLSAKLIELDEARRRHLVKLQEAQAARNAKSKDIGKAKASKDEATAATLMKEVADLKEVIQSGETEERQLNKALEDALAVIPNMPRADVPEGKDEHDNKEVRKVGAPKTYDFKPKQHFELGEALGLMDFEAAAKISGARFVFLEGALSRLERAIASFMIDTHTGPANGNLAGYTEYNPPLLVKDHTAYGTGNLPKFAEDLFSTSKSSVQQQLLDEMVDLAGREPKGLGLGYHLGIQSEADAVKGLASREETAKKSREERLEIFRPIVDKLLGENRLWLIPTAEVSLTNLVREQILDEDKLPMRMTAWTPCFRSEAGAAGKDTRGMIRQHQFSKVELVSITTPETSTAEHERMTGCAEEILKRLGLPFRTMLLCTGDMGFASQKTYDIEVWLPGQDAYREISSCSVCGDFQARRMGARYRDKASKDVKFVHTLNGSGLAVGRTLVAVMENYQNADGSITVPEALRPYMNGLERIAK
jgi:seryl-tRNA synthetase